MRCRTVDQAFAAGWDDAADDAPLTDSEITTLVALHSHHLNSTRPQEMAG